MGRDTNIMGWRPPQRPQWLQEFMKTPGYIKVQLSLLLILATSSVSSTALQISRATGNTSVGNTFGRNESLEVEVGELRLRVTGKHTTDLVQSLKKTLEDLEVTISDEPSYPFIEREDGSIIPRPDSSSGVMFLQSP